MASRNFLSVKSMKRVFEANYAGIRVRYAFRNKKTGIQFGKYAHVKQAQRADIELSDEQFRSFRELFPLEIPDEYVEFKGLLYITSRYLRPYNCCFFHAVSFLYREKVWLLAAKSGTGKTTQYNNWKNLFPEEITMISGDMPLLDFRGERILVHPSPWNGKERIGNELSGELGGIVFLNQDKENSMKEAELRESISRLFSQFTLMPENEEEILFLSSMVERIEKKIPLWVFSNDGSERSTMYLHEKLNGYLLGDKL